MWNKFYVLIIDRGGLLDLYDYKKFHEKLTNADGIKAWWHYLESTYILKVDFKITAQNVSEFVQKIAPNKKFFVCEINLGNHNGWLPQEAWDWINKNTKQNSG